MPGGKGKGGVVAAEVLAGGEVAADQRVVIVGHAVRSGIAVGEAEWAVERSCGSGDVGCAVDGVARSRMRVPADGAGAAQGDVAVGSNVSRIAAAAAAGRP